MLRRLLAAGAIAVVSALPLADLAAAGNKGDGNFCPGRDNTCPSGNTGGGGGGGGGNGGNGGNGNGGNGGNGGGGGGGGTGNNTGNRVDDCDNRTDGIHIISGQAVTCNDFDVQVDVL